MDSVFIRFCGGNVVAWMNRSLGGLGKNTRGILNQKRKKKRKKGTRKLLKKMSDRPFDGGQKLKKKGKHLSWFDYELCLVVKDGEWLRALLKYVY